ncbi:MAG: HAMP domain-containing sensor histidine kinase [Candidatus Saccharimonadales bacterium]
MAISFSFSTILYHDASSVLSRGLQRESQRISKHFPDFQDSPLLQPGPDLDDARHRILLRIIGFNLIVLATAGLASYLLARRTLSPIEAAHAQQQRFTADVSHELRTPLTALRMESEVALLNNKASSRELRATLSSNIEEVGKLEVLINNLLRLSRLEEAELRHSFEPVELKILIDRAIGKTSILADSQKITVTTDCDSSVVECDADSLEQLLVILLDNAIKYSPPGNTVEASAKKGTVTIQDHGIGIEADALEHIFERFYRADSSRTKTTVAGHGLGLSIARMIADVHHAELALVSKPGKGTIATLSIPASSNG